MVRGRADLVLPPGDDGTGATALVRADGADLFGYGAREAVIRAAGLLLEDMPPFGAPATAEEMVEALLRVGIHAAVVHDREVTCEDHRLEAVGILAMAHGWQVDDGEPGTDHRLRPVGP